MPDQAGSGKFQADVRHVNSTDRIVNLEISPQIKGDATLSPDAHAIAAACEASGRKVWMRYRRYRSDSPGTGTFDGVVLAIREDTV